MESVSERMERGVERLVQQAVVQGFPRKVTDTAVIAKVATLFGVKSHTSTGPFPDPAPNP